MAETPPYPSDMTGRCADCGRFPVLLLRISPPNVYRYRCLACIEQYERQREERNRHA
jgi:hypothetical protein